MMKTWTKNQTVSHTILLILLVVNFTQSLLVLIYDDLLNSIARDIYIDQFRYWITFLYWLAILSGFPAIALVIKLNQEQLHELYIDKFYVVLLIASGLLGLYSLPYNCFTVAAVLYGVYTLFDRKVKFGVVDDNALRMILFIAIAYAGLILFVGNFVDNHTLDFLNTDGMLSRFLLETIPISISQEAVYRGMLNMFLRDLGMNETRTFYLQAFLFWISHINYVLSSPVTFWIILPVVSLILGYIAYRSKSLTPSTIAHILYNSL